MNSFIHNQTRWPGFEYDSGTVLRLVGSVRNLQGKLSGKMEVLGFTLRNEAHVEALTQDIIKSGEIEGEVLDSDQVRSSIARRLGMDLSDMVESDRYIDGVVEMVLDATQNFESKLTKDRLFGWHSSMFPSGRSGIYKIIVGDWRDDAKGPMQVVSGAIGKEKVHFEAPPSEAIEHEMSQFIKWFNSEKKLDPAIKAGIAHLWFVTIHPFEDGNGRITRAITDMMLCRSDKSPQRFYSMSSQIRRERKAYYNALEAAQKGTMDITIWLIWFLECLERSLLTSNEIIKKVLSKHQFWMINKETLMNERQRTMINMLLDGFFGKLTNAKWAKINKCSSDTALRDIQDLLRKKILKQESSGGRSTSYVLAMTNA